MSNKAGKITPHLRALAQEAITLSDDGEYITREMAMAMLLWELALGKEERDPNDEEKIIIHRPAEWAMKLIVERLDGKAPQSVDEDTRHTVAERIAEQARAVINAETAAVLDNVDGLAEPDEDDD